MANAWGELSWNSGLWGEQSNAIATPTGLGLNSAQGTTAGYPFPGWGSLSWSSGVWGNVQNSGAELTGIGLTTDSGNVGISGEINAGWGRLTYGENAWGIQGDVLITGIGLDVGVGTGSVTIDVQPELLGEQQNLSLGDPDIIIATEIFLNENPLPNLTVEEGTVDPGPDVVLNGIGLTSTTGTLEGYNSEGWGRTYWGEEVWGASGFWAFGTPSGISLTANLGTVDAKPVTIAEPSGIGLTAEEGTVDPSPDATVVGIGLSASVAVGSVIEADANVTITGIGLEIAQGQAELDANTIALVGVIELLPTLEISLNNAVAGASAEVNLTGIGLTTNAGSINVQAWQIVNTGTSVNWNDIDTAA